MQAAALTELPLVGVGHCQTLMLGQVDRSLTGGIPATVDDGTRVLVAEIAMQSLLPEVISGIVFDEERHEFLHRGVNEALCGFVDGSSHLRLVDRLSCVVDEIVLETCLDVVDALVL